MKRILLSLVLVAVGILSYAKGYEAKFSQTNSSEYQISFELKNWNLATVELSGTTFQQIIFDASTVTEDKGWAELPFISGSIQLPAKKNVDLNVTYTDYTDYQLDYPLVPSRGVIYRNQEPETIPYEIDPASIVNKFYPANLAIAEEPFIVRDVRGISVRVFPFQYNSATNTLRVYSKVDVLLVENNEPATNPLMTENNTPVREAIGMYQSLFLNYDASKVALAMAQYGDILVITTARDSETIDPFIQWKREKGYNVSKEVVATGTNVKALIQQKYNENNNLLYVQLVGDWADIKSNQGAGANAPMDTQMGNVVGTDNFPEIAIGRFSGSNAQHITTQINKAIEYEKNPNTDSDWHSAFIGIASNEGSGIGDDGEIDYTHVQRIYNQRLQQPTFTYNTHLQNYAPGANASTLAGHINAGASTIAYCGHGSETTFVTTGFSNNNVNQLTNGSKLPFIVSVACVNGAFHNSSDCFAEAWLKKENGGAVVTWMSTINQPWTPPMRGQDYFYDILIGGFDYTPYSGQNGLTTNEQRTTWGAITVNSFNLMLTETATTENVQTVQTWTTFGDVNLQLRTKTPDEIVSSMPTILVGMPFATAITSGGLPVKDALVCISQDGVYLSALTDENGEISIENEFLPGEVLLVVTAFNTTTIYETIECVPADGAYLIKDSFAFGGDGILSFGETSALNIVMKNVGMENTTSESQVTITCDDPMLTIVTGTATYPLMTAGETASATSSFVVTASPDITDGQSFAINITAVNDGNTWESKIYVKAYKYVIEYAGLNWAGSFEPGTTIQLAVSYENAGGFKATEAVATLASVNPNVNILNPTYNFGTIESTGIVTAVYNVEISAAAPATEPIIFYSFVEVAGNIASDTADISIANSCNVVFTLSDTYGDGWNGNKLNVTFDDGTPMVTYTINSGNSAVFTKEINTGTTVTVTFVTGQYAYECSYNIKYETGEPIYQSSGTPTNGIAKVFECNCAGGSASTCDPITNLEAVVNDTAVDLTWEASDDATHFMVKRNGVTIGTPHDPYFTDEIAPIGSNNYCVIAIYNTTSCESLPECTSVTIAEEVCSAPTGLQVEQESTSMILTWNYSSCSTGSNIYADDELIAENVQGTTYVHEDFAKGNICYHITALNSMGESDESEKICMDYLRIEANSIEANIYPNPTSGNITIECAGMNQVSVYSLTGVLVHQVNARSDSQNINLSSLASGTYLVKVIHNDGIMLKKLIKQ